MMSWLPAALRAHAEIAFFLVLGLGQLFGRLTIKNFKLAR